MVTAGPYFGLLVKCFKEYNVSFFFSSRKPACSSFTKSQRTSLFIQNCLTLYTDSGYPCWFIQILNTLISLGQQPDLAGIGILLCSEDAFGRNSLSNMWKVTTSANILKRWGRKTQLKFYAMSRIRFWHRKLKTKCPEGSDLDNTSSCPPFKLFRLSDC